MQTIPIKLRRKHERAIVPRYSHEGDAGFDLFFAGEEAVVLAPGMRRLMPTGLEMEIPPGFEIQIRPRSGWAFKEGVTVLNAPGTIDSGYRGEILICLVNLGHEPATVLPGARIAQGVLVPVWQAKFELAEDLAGSARGSGGFGSTGQ